MQETYWWSPIVYFALHTFVSSVIFIIVALPAVGLFALVRFAENLAGIPTFAVHVFGFLEYAILLIDSCIFIVFLGRNAWTFIREIAQ